MRRFLILGITIFLIILGFAAMASAQKLDSNYKEGEVLIKFKPQASLMARNQIMADINAQVLRQFDRISVQVLSLDGLTVEEAIKKYSDDPAVEFIEPNYKCFAYSVPNDPMFDTLWGMQNTGQSGGTPDADISAVDAWSVFTGSQDVIVGVIDTGVDYNHEDLAANIWTNPGEIPDNGLDDDGNGLVDDYHGYDYYNNDGDPLDDNGHGSHCSGTIGGVGDNGVGVAGVNWHVSIMAIKFLDRYGYGDTGNAIACVEYAVMMGANVLSNSWGGSGYSAAMEAAISDANDAGIIFVAAAGNDYGNNNDLYPHYPSNYDVPNVVSVAATDNDDQLAYFSNIGPTTVDLAAPGVGIYSTVLNNGYAYYDGTSMATPHVSGAFALLLGRFPGLGVQEAKNLIFNSVDPLPQLDGLCVTGGRLNVDRAIADPDTTLPDGISDLAVAQIGGDWLDFSWTAPGDDGSVGTASSYDMRYSTTGTSWDDAIEVSGEPIPQVAGSAEAFRVTGLDFSTTYDFAIRAVDDYGNLGPVLNWANAVTTGPPTITVTPASLEEILETGATSQQTLTISNTGSGILDFSIPEPTLINKAQPVLLGSGGPDDFGYRWTDSDEVGGPVFDWVDISSLGTIALSGCSNCNDGPYDLGFGFSFYGNVFDQFRICSNGFISFTSTSYRWGNSSIPNSYAPANMIAPYWDDLNLYYYGTGRVYYYFDGTRMIIQYDNISRYGSTGPYNFEVFLYPSGRIVYQYLTLGTYNTSCTVGIQNADGTDGVQVVYNSDYLHENLAIKIQGTPQWLTVSPDSGSVPPGGSMDVIVDLSAVELCGDAFDGEIHIINNDPMNQDLVVPVHLDVIGYPDIAVNPLELDFDTPFVGTTTTQILDVDNLGCALLSVTSIVSDNPAFTVDVTAFDVPIRGRQEVTVSFTPTTDGVANGVLTINSNDDDQPVVAVNVTGQGLYPPILTAAPDSLSAILNTGESITRHLTLSNTGGSNLDFSISLTSESLYTLLGPSVKFQVQDFPAQMATDQTRGNATEKVDRGFGKRVYTGGINASSLLNILVYEDGPGEMYYDQALGNLGLSRTLVTSMVDFSMELNSGTNWDLVIVNSYRSWFSHTDLDVLSNRVANGKYTIFYAWDISSYVDHPLLTNLGVSYVSSFDSPSDIYPVDSGLPLFNDPNQVPWFLDWTDDQWGTDGEYVDVLPGASQQAYFVYNSASYAIVINSDQSSIFNAFEAMNYNRDYDYDGKMDVLELIENEISYLVGQPSSWLVVSPLGGTVPPGSSMDLDVTFTGVDNSSGINSVGGVFDSGIVISSNDVVNPGLTVPAHMEISTGSDLVVDITPHDTPIVIPAGGGIFSYDVRIRNISSRTIEATVGVQAQLPGGSAMLLSSLPVSVFPGGTVTRTNIVQAVPDNAPEGLYIYKVGVGLSIVEVLDLDSFTFEKISTGAAAKAAGVWSLEGWDSLAGDENPDSAKLPTTFSLGNPVPNPFNPLTKLAFELPHAALVQLDIYDLRGRLVRTLVNGQQMDAGRHEINWQGKDNTGRSVSGGVYFYRIHAGEYAMTKRMTLVK